MIFDNFSNFFFEVLLRQSESFLSDTGFFLCHVGFVSMKLYPTLKGAILVRWEFLLCQSRTLSFPIAKIFDSLKEQK